MLAYVARRLVLSASMMLLVVAATFSLYHLLPGDPALAVLGQNYNDEAAARINKELGLDRPLHEQFLAYLGSLSRGDLGRSHVSSRPVTDDLRRVLPATLELALAALILASIGGVTIGVVTARYPGGWIDTGGLTLALAGTSLPIFWLGFMALQAFGEGGWAGLGLPLGHRYDAGLYKLDTFMATNPRATGFLLYDTLIVAGDWRVFRHVLAHLTLPALVLATVPMAVIARITRAAMGEALRQDFIRTARAKGLAERVVIWKHGLRNALIPIVTSAGTQLGYLVGGAVLTETIFSWAGMGTYVVAAIQNLDVKPLQACVLVVAAGFVVINLLVDLSYGLIDPRVRASSQ